jgi:hypothetical protein
MTEQRYEYTVTVIQDVEVADFEQNLAERINKMANDGWQLTETIQMDGTTSALVYERPADSEE